MLEYCYIVVTRFNLLKDEINNYKGYGYVEKSLQAIKHNERATKLNQIKNAKNQRLLQRSKTRGL